MRRLLIVLVAATLAVAFPARADRAYDHHAYGHHGGSSGLAGLVIFGALTSMAIISEQQRRPVYVDPYYVAPAYSQPPVYIEQMPASPAPATNAQNTWYYCASSSMYYPYTKACPEGWQAVPARPY
jgi:hypothetical protein